jgi:ribosomal protein L7/L12
MSTPEDIINQINAEIIAGKKIQAIKTLRQATGMGLKEAKDHIDSGKPITANMIKNTDIENTPPGCGSKATTVLVFISIVLYQLLF